MMLVLAALSMFLVSTTFMALPVLAGRAFFHSISFYMLSLELEHDGLYFLLSCFKSPYTFLLCFELSNVNNADICAFWIGLCIMRKIYKITCFVYDHVVTRRTDLLFNHILKCMQNVLLFSIWVKKHSKNLTSYIYKLTCKNLMNRSLLCLDCLVSLSTL